MKGQQCSGKWSDIFNNSCYTKQEGKRTSYAEARDKPLDEETTKDKPLAWTKSSLVGKAINPNILVQAQML